jgi:hypothetical protein
MQRMRWRGLCLAVVLSVGIVGCAGAPRTVTATPTTTSPTTATAGSTPAPTRTLTPSATPTPTASALGDLAGFVDAAREVDTRLQAATRLINASVRTDAVVVDERTAAAVKAIDTDMVAAAIPAGMPAELMRQVLTVYSELVSRTRALTYFGYAGTSSRLSPAGETALAEGEHLVQCLANGSPAAYRFEADLAAVGTTAGAMAPLQAVDEASLVAAELEALLTEIELRNGGCGSCGGYVATTLSSIIWDDAAPGATTRTGSVVSPLDGAESGIAFTATYVPGQGWTVELRAC